LLGRQRPPDPRQRTGIVAPCPPLGAIADDEIEFAIKPRRIVEPTDLTDWGIASGRARRPRRPHLPGRAYDTFPGRSPLSRLSPRPGRAILERGHPFEHGELRLGEFGAAFGDNAITLALPLQTLGFENLPERFGPSFVERVKRHV
jgi:hypothetical protein